MENMQIPLTRMAVKRHTSIIWWLLAPLFAAIAVLFMENISTQDHDAFPQEPLSRKMLNTLRKDAPQPAKTTDNDQSDILQPITTIELQLPPERFNQIRKIRILPAQKRNWQYCTFSWNNISSPKSAKIKIHGWTSLATDRKSFSVKLTHAIPFSSAVQLKRFFLINMVHDAGQFHGWFSYSLLNELGLFPNYFQYVTVKINDQTQGVYLLIERTQDALLRTERELQFVMRRRTDKLFATKYLRSELVDTSPIDTFIGTYTTATTEEELTQTADQVLDVDLYLSWLAYNSLVEIPDNLDELFFYQTITPEKRPSKLKIAAWDYDLLFSSSGNTKQSEESPLTSSIECGFGHLVVETPALFARYKIIIRQLLYDTLSEENISRTLHDIEDQHLRISAFLPPGEKKIFLKNSRKHIAHFKIKILQRRDLLIQLINR